MTIQRLQFEMALVLMGTKKTDIFDQEVVLVTTKLDVFDETSWQLPAVTF